MKNYITLKMTYNEKIIIEQAAKLSNISLSSYILIVSLKQAIIDLSQRDMITLNSEERDSLLYALKNPMKANNELKSLFYKNKF